MEPRIGWYSRAEWMRTFRPDGLGHIVIDDGENPPEDIAFNEIVCDGCNGDAGDDHADGSPGRIFYDGSDSLCEACGAKAEAQERQRRELEAVRKTLREESTMSAYIVDRDHIRYLVSAAVRLDRDALRWFHANVWHELPTRDRERASQVGQMLWDENIRSIEGRYPGTKGKPDRMPGKSDDGMLVYSHASGDWPGPIDPVQVLKSCNCYEYQSCEHEEWSASEAHAFIEALRARAVRTLPGYEAAAWGAPKVVDTI